MVLRENDLGSPPGITPARIALQRRARDGICLDKPRLAPALVIPTNSMASALIPKPDIDVAETYIRHHEERYRTPLERIAGWRYNPTVRHVLLPGRCSPDACSRIRRRRLLLFFPLGVPAHIPVDDQDALLLLARL